jgi:uncharacterized protein (TIGR03437 family)
MHVSKRFLKWATLAALALPATAQNIVTFAGGSASGSPAPYGDGGSAAGASLWSPKQIARDSAGNYYIADPGHQAIRRVNQAGTISTFAGAGTGKFVEGSLAANAVVNAVFGLVVAGNSLYYSDYSNNAIRKIDLASTAVTTVAGTGVAGSDGDGGPALQATLYGPKDVQWNGQNLLYFGDANNLRIRAIDLAAGTVNAAVGNGKLTSLTVPEGDGNDARKVALLAYFQPFTLDGAGNLYLLDGYWIRKVDVGTNIIHSIGGNDVFLRDFASDGTLPASISPFCVAADGAGNVFFGDKANGQYLIRRIDVKTGTLSTVAGARVNTQASTGDNGPALKAGLLAPNALNIDRNGNMFLLDNQESRVREVPLAGVPFPALPGQTPPSVTGPSSIVNSASLTGAVASGAWVTIFGQNLSGTTRVWAGPDFVNGALPVSLDGMSVTIGGKAAYVYFVSPGQVNVLAPVDTAVGPVAVQVTTLNGSSGVVTVTKNAASPAFFQFDPQGRKYIAAVTLDGVFAGPTGLYGTQLTTRPVKPGEIVQLYATGLGATSPAYPDGKLLTQAYALTVLLSVKIGGQAAIVSYAGLAGPGLYQLNVAIPALPVGDAAVVIDLGNGVASAAGVSYLAIGK